MRPIDADAFKQYIREGMEEMKKYFKTDKGLELALKTTESFLKDIDEQPTIEAQPKTAYIFIDINKIAKGVAEKALDEITYEGKTIREWVEIIINQQPYKPEEEG